MTHEHLSNELLLRHLDAELPAEERPAIEQHLEACAECRDRTARLRAVSGAIEDYSTGLLDSPSAGPQRRALMAALEARAARPAFPAAKKVQAALAVAACLVLALAISLVISQQPKRPASPPQMAEDVFIALPYSDENLSSEGAVVLQVELPRSAVALAGMPVSDGPADGRVKAEVVVGADGLARAIRFLN
jgi:anti-sigma factor ChrR (cupin superfamily)